MVKYMDYDVALKNLQTWLDTQLHLPIIETEVLLKFINATEGDLEETKRIIDAQYSMRNNHPHIFLDRDPLSPSIMTMLNYVEILRLPGQTLNGGKVTVCGLLEHDVETFNHNEGVKILMMFLDLFMVTPDPDGVPKGEIVIFDTKGFTTKHLARINLAHIRVLMRFVQESASFNITEIHVINAPQFLDNMLTILRPIIHSEIFKLIKFHQPDTETVFDFVPKELLPTTMGGKACTDELKKLTLQSLTDKRDYLMNRKYWAVDETKRPAGQQRPDEMEGCFKSLNFD